MLPSSDSKVRYELSAVVSNLSAGGARLKLDKKLPSSEAAPSVRNILDFPLDVDDPLGDRRSGEEDSEDEERVPPELVSTPCKIIDVVERGIDQTVTLSQRVQDLIDEVAPLNMRSKEATR